jgi:glycosyltransferase involved in cell wall biosynthesis
VQLSETAVASQPLPSIDVIIPFHIIHNYLRQAIESALSSFGVQVRILLIDDSDEQYPEWLREFSENPNVSVIKNFNRGYLGALETGVLNTTSEYVGFLDSDDLTHPYRFYNQINFMRHNDLEISSSSISRIDKNGKFLRHQGLLGSQLETVPPRIRLLFGAYGADSSLVLKIKVVRENWSAHGLLPPQFADYGFLLKSISHHTYSFCRDGMYYYRIHDFQMSREKSLLESWQAVFPLWRELLSDLGALLPRTSHLPIDSYTAAAIAFPSLLPKLDRHEVIQLNDAIESFIFDLNSICNLTPSDVAALKMRLLIGSRLRYASSWRYLPILMWRIARNFASGLFPRKN